MSHLPYISRETHQPTPEERLADFKAKAAYDPMLSAVIGNQFQRKFYEEQA
jgi:hypothetical protein